MTWSMFYGFEEHTVAAHAELIAKISKDDLLAVISTKFFPKINSLILLGSVDKLSTQFSDFGDIQIVEQ